MIKMLFSKPTDFKPGIAALEPDSKCLKVPGCAVVGLLGTETATGHIISDTISGFTLSCLGLLCLYGPGLWKTRVMAADLGTLGTVAMPSLCSKAPLCPWMGGKHKQDRQAVGRLWTKEHPH